ncbi:MAG TPA: PH domain-containing protein [Thermoanaerobaculia bacterium]|nr:PH domain-containing protein [Thermoanaerobaculia bacterium]
MSAPLRDEETGPPGGRDRLRALVARWLRVPPPPEAPAGSPESVRRFRAAPGFYRYRLLSWGLKQVGAAWGLVVGLSFVRFVPPDWFFARWVFVAEAVGVAAYVAQLPFTLFLVGLDYRNRWYIVTDRSLRIREGVVRVREQTMSFANVQNLAIRQGPLQRLFGIADLKVRTAGGGGKSEGHEGAQEKDLHLGFFRGVADAEAIRDLILARLRRLAGAGLGDPDEPAEAPAPSEPAAPPRPEPGPGAGEAPALAAARELLAEAAELRRALPGRGP